MTLRLVICVQLKWQLILAVGVREHFADMFHLQPALGRGLQTDLDRLEAEIDGDHSCDDAIDVDWLETAADNEESD